ncbi:trypsin-like serine protease [Ensifer sp. MPMI2T]|nr:trypsin-like serine protease [Ensifer sp. MPMI2T]
MRKLGSLLLVCWLSATTASAFEFVRPESLGGGAPVIIEGAEVTDPQRWPATFIFKATGSGCTATAVGERVVITAAHCVGNAARGTVRVNNDIAVGLQCFHHPGYPANETTDFALCLTDSGMTDIPFEVISTAIAYPRLGHDVVLLGFGCTQAGGHDGSFGTLFEGKAKVVRRPDGRDIDTITKGGAAVCFGDSGGASYFQLTSNGNRRALVAINSRGDINKFSFLSTLATPEFVSWAVEWANQRNVAICGLDVEANGCR